MYRAPQPCPPGYSLYVDEVNGVQFGMPSCVAVFSPDLYSVARATCATAWPEPVNPAAATYMHLATFNSVNVRAAHK